ncbi:MAG TPA: DUF72 domain-containing protein [Polyangiaceae bacterium]|nr:DUF72 domain-containing protein [Polyangiaceae bacterium]
MSGNVYVGTAGWALPKPHAHAFPEGGSQLARYAQRFPMVEINSTFWRRHRPATFQRWHDSVPASFKFAVKIPRTLTHEAGLAAPLELLRAFFHDVAPLRRKLGPVLVQMPASLEFEARRAGAFFRTLRSLHAGCVVCEPRHASWYGGRADELFLLHRVTRVIADPPRPPVASEPGGARSVVYLRLHGSPHRYYSSYDTERLQQFAGVIARRGRCAAYCVFDNTASGAAAGDALRMLELTPRGRKAAAPAITAE